jgi:hypothetical protein
MGLGLYRGNMGNLDCCMGRLGSMRGLLFFPSAGDDVVFFIFLYQKWIYRVDYTRVNEYGYQPEDKETVAQQAKIDTADSSKTKVADCGTEGLRNVGGKRIR